MKPKNFPVKKIGKFFIAICSGYREVRSSGGIELSMEVQFVQAKENWPTNPEDIPKSELHTLQAVLTVP